VPDSAPAIHAAPFPHSTRRIQPVSSDTPAAVDDDPEHHAKHGTGHPRVGECAREPAQCARDTEAEEHLSIHMLPQQHESLCGANQVRNRDGCNGDFGAGLDGQHRGQETADAETRD
jgi:hypothetical protein